MRNRVSASKAFERIVACAILLPALAGCGSENGSGKNPTGLGSFSGAAGQPAGNGGSGAGGSAPVTGTGGQSAGAPGAGGSRPVTPGGTGGAIVGAGGAAVGTGGAAVGAGGAAVGSGGTAGAAGAAGNAGAAGAAGSTSPFPQLPRPTTTDGPGPFKDVVKVMSTPPGGWLVYPKDIGMGGIKHPLFIFGPGGGTTPQTYEAQGHWDRYGSYGFVIYVLPMSTGNGADMKKGLDWLIAQNDEMSSPLYQHLDTTKVCASGHSQGSITVFAFMPDPRVTTTVLISGGSFDGMGPSHLRNDTMFLCGPDGSADIAQPQCATDFKNSTIPTFYTEVQGSTHLTSGRLGWAATIAWMLWHLAGQEDLWKKEFLEPTGKFRTGIFKSQLKNW